MGSQKGPQGPFCLTINKIMNIAEIITESWPGRNRNRIYKLLIDTIDSGPFDGGCVIFAQALKMKYGGEIVVLLTRNEQADHAAVKIGDILIDADGPAKVDSFIKRFERNERVEIFGIRPIQDNDLPDAPRNIGLSEKIATLL
jgi:hypothetical protein